MRAIKIADGPNVTQANSDVKESEVNFYYDK